MKKFYILLSLMVSINFLASYSQIDSLYLGQIPPDNTRKIFNLAVDPGYMATEKIAISPDGKEIYYEETNNSWTSFKIRYYKYYDDIWNGPFNLFNGYYCISLSPDGNNLYLENNGAEDCWIAERNDTSWDTPSRFLKNFNVHSLNVTNNGNYYMSSNPPGGLGSLDISRLIITGTDTIIEGLGLPLNSNVLEGDFTIARDESFIIFMSSRTGGFGMEDLYISFRKSDYTWTNPLNMGSSINTSTSDFGPYVTVDNKYLFYTSGYNGPSTIYWIKVDELIDDLKELSGITKTTFSELSDVSITIYPNPANEFIIIKSDQAWHGEINYSLYGVDGKIILQGKTKLNNFINISHLDKGMYYLRIEINGELIIKKIIYN